jgi:hypothetical protein
MNLVNIDGLTVDASNWLKRIARHKCSSGRMTEWKGYISIIGYLRSSDLRLGYLKFEVTDVCSDSIIS